MNLGSALLSALGSVDPALLPPPLEPQPSILQNFWRVNSWVFLVSLVLAGLGLIFGFLASGIRLHYDIKNKDRGSKYYEYEKTAREYSLAHNESFRQSYFRVLAENELLYRLKFWIPVIFFGIAWFSNWVWLLIPFLIVVAIMIIAIVTGNRVKHGKSPQTYEERLNHAVRLRMGENVALGLDNPEIRQQAWENIVATSEPSFIAAVETRVQEIEASRANQTLNGDALDSFAANWRK